LWGGGVGRWVLKGGEGEGGVVERVGDWEDREVERCERRWQTWDVAFSGIAVERQLMWELAIRLG